MGIVQLVRWIRTLIGSGRTPRKLK